MRISVIQPGARLHYGVPAVFAGAGVLEALYTDLHAEHWPLRLARLLPARATPKPVRRLLGRRLPPEIPPHRVRDRPLETIARTLAGGNASAAITARLLADLERVPLGEGAVVYTVIVNQDIDTMRRLKARGVKIVHECIIGPDVGPLLAAEHERFPGFERRTDHTAVAEGRARDAEKYALCDMILVPSPFTARAVAALAPAGARIETVPYGLDLAAFSAPAAPEPGRVLTVGSVGLRKGHPDLAAAARRLAAERPDVTVRVVGPAPPGLTARPEMAGPTYVGQVPRAQVVAEFARADVFAFPTICDSFGLVLVEAMAMGVPVVATPNCGDVVRDGVDGLVVPPRDPDALAAAIATITGDRAMREEMSYNARERARDFSLEAYAARLMAAMERV